MEGGGAHYKLYIRMQRLPTFVFVQVSLGHFTNNITHSHKKYNGREVLKNGLLSCEDVFLTINTLVMFFM